MNIVNISGSVGEQMFQYIFALWLQKADKDLLINVPKNNYIGRLFPLKPINIATVEEVRELVSITTLDSLKKLFGLSKPKGKTISDSSLRFRPELRNEKHKNTFFDGLWMAHQYVDQIKSDAKHVFSIEPHLLPESSQDLIKNLESCESVAIHVFCPSSKENTCTSDYYNWAITNIRSFINNPKFTVLTDDKEWVENNLILDRREMEIILSPAESHYSIVPVLCHGNPHLFLSVLYFQ